MSGLPPVPYPQAYIKYATEMLTPIISAQRVTTTQPFQLSESNLKTAPPPYQLEDLAAEMLESQSRLEWWQAERTSDRDIYRQECQRCKLPMNPWVMNALPSERPRPGKPYPVPMKVLNLQNATLSTIAPLVDIIYLHKEVEELVLRDNFLDNSSIQLLALLLHLHKKLRFVDISHNPAVSISSASALYQLLVRNTHITQCRFQGTVRKHAQAPPSPYPVRLSQ